MSPQEKTLRDKQMLIAVLLLNTLAMYLSAVIDLLKGEVGLSAWASVFTTAIWCSAFWKDNTIFDFCVTQPQ